MLKKERNYEFRKRLLQIHKKDIRDYSVKCTENELEVEDGAVTISPISRPWF